MTKEQKLSAIQGRSTKYEVAAIRGDQKILICYTNAHSRHGLLRACQSRGKELSDLLGTSDAYGLAFSKKAADGFVIGDWSFRFTGRTQRQAIIEGELTWIHSLAKVNTAQGRQ